jgi:hypothetical protein
MTPCNLVPCPDRAELRCFECPNNASRPAPAQAGDTLEDNVRYLLDRCPHTVRHKYKGGPESLIDSLCITFTKMQELAGKAATPAAKEGGTSPDLSDERILRVWDTHVNEPTAKLPLTDADKINFARGVLAHSRMGRT